MYESWNGPKYLITLLLLTIVVGVARADNINNPPNLGQGTLDQQMWMWDTSTTPDSWRKYQWDTNEFDCDDTSMTCVHGPQITMLGDTIGDDAGELQSGTALPATCNVGDIYLKTDEAMPATTTNGFENWCTAVNTWKAAGDVKSYGRSGGQRVTGDTAADGNLTLYSTNDADMGTVTLGDTPSDTAETAFKWAPTYTRGNVSSTTKFIDFAPTVTNNGTVADTTVGYNCGGTITNATGALVSLPQCLRASWTLTSSAAIALPSASTFFDAPTYSQTAAATTSQLQEINLQPTYATTGAVASTITTAYGMRFAPTITTDNAGGTQTITNLVGVAISDDTNSGAGTETVTNYIGFDVADLSPANSGTAIAYRQAGTDDTNRLAGKTILGSGATTNAPAAQLEVWSATDKNEVARFRTTETNDDPNLKIIQTRATAAASATTNIDLDLTASAPTDVLCPASSVCLIEARTLCHCTSGSSCTTHQGGANISNATVKNNGGTISLIGAVTTAMASQIDASLTSLTLSVSTPNIRMAVVVPANFAHTCHITYFVSNVGT